MADIAEIRVEVETADESGAGTDGTVYIGIAGREFHIDTGSDDFERNSNFTYILGEGHNVENWERNNPRNPQLTTSDLDDYPVYLRFEPSGGSADWKLGRIKITARTDTGSSIVYIPPATNFNLTFDLNLWLGQNYGKFVYLKKRGRPGLG